jgi:hypothetical protein
MPYVRAPGKDRVSSEKDRAAQEVIDAKSYFEISLEQAKMPPQRVSCVVRAARKYIGLTAGGPLIHRNLTGEISGLAGYLKLERNRVPGDVLREANRLHCLLFSGHDPYFEGIKPPGLWRRTPARSRTLYFLVITSIERRRHTPGASYQ